MSVPPPDAADNMAEDQWGEMGEVIDPELLVKSYLPYAQVFDARELPTEFLLDTYDALSEEPKSVMRDPITLPYGMCYFEFSEQLSVLALAVGTKHIETDDGLETRGRPICLLCFCSEADDSPFISAASIDNAVIDGEMGPLYTTEAINRSDTQRLIGGRVAQLLIGALELLKHRLLVNTHEPDPAPRLTTVRAKKGKYPISGDSWVLTVNVPAVRHIAAATKLGAHESPALHWRRSHWRVLHRGSEFESQVVVRKCLVGDPAKGFIRKSYRLTHGLPMLAPTPPPHIEGFPS